MIEYLEGRVKEIAKLAGEIIMEVYNGMESIDVSYKDDDSPLTKADRLANDIIVKGLEGLDFVFPVISEENKEIAFDIRKHFNHVWMVDPLDGTKEFIKRNGEFTVNIALIERNRPILGVVYTPVTDELYFGALGRGAYLEHGQTRQVLRASSFSLKDPGLHVICSRSHLNIETKEIIDRLNEPQLIQRGSSLKFMELANGRAHFYPRVAPTMEWDLAASDIILHEAGGGMVQYGTDKPLVYNKEFLINPGFFAYGQLIVD
jgi:3'(2'), 5'-bisphosphate nucleotidase